MLPRETKPSSSVNSEEPQSSIVRKADTVLTNELEGRTSRVPEILPEDLLSASQNFEATVEALRQQARKLVDTFVEVLKQRPEQVTQLISEFPTLAGPLYGDGSGPVSLLKVPSPVTPGQCGTVEFTLINDDPNETAECTLYSTDLIGVSGHRIPHSQISLSPNPLRISPGQSVDGRIEIQLPSGTPPGTYAGLIQTEDLGRLPAVIQLSVVP